MEEKVLRASGRNKERGSDVSLMSKFDSLIRRAGRDAAGPKIETKRMKRHSISQERERERDAGEKGKYIYTNLYSKKLCETSCCRIERRR